MLKNTASGTSPKEDERNSGWIDRQTRTPEARRMYEQERLVTWVAEEIARAMDENGLSKAELAEKLGTSRAHVTQVLSGSRNMTLRTLADLAWACNQRAAVAMETLRQGVFITQPVTIHQNVQPRLVQTRADSRTLRSEPAEVEDLAS